MLGKFRRFGLDPDRRNNNDTDSVNGKPPALPDKAFYCRSVGYKYSEDTEIGMHLNFMF